MTEIITIIIAVYGAALATFTFVFQQLEKRKKIKVTLSLGFMAHGLSKPIDVITLEAANSGQVPVHLSSCHLALPETKEKFVGRLRYSRDFPVTLNPGENIEAWIESEIFIKAVQKTVKTSKIAAIAVFSNKGGGVFRSKPEQLSLDQMLFAKDNAA